MEAQLQVSIENLSKIFHNKMAVFEAALKDNSQSNEGDLNEQFTSFRTFIKEALSCLQQQVKLVVQSVDRLEMQGRRKILLLHGVAEEKNEVVADVVVNLIKNKLEVEGFSVNDIKRCHRMGRPTAPHRHRPILFKLQQVSIRDKIWFAKTKFKGSGITTSEFLTKSRHDVFMAAREKFGVSKCWTKEGRIYVLGSSGSRHHVISLDDIHNIHISNTHESTKPDNRTERAEPSKRKRNIPAKK